MNHTTTNIVPLLHAVIPPPRMNNTIILLATEVNWFDKKT